MASLGQNDGAYEMRVLIRNMRLDVSSSDIRKEIVDTLGLLDPIDIYHIKKGFRMSSAFLTYTSKEECQSIASSLNGTYFLSNQPVKAFLADPPRPDSLHGQKQKMAAQKQVKQEPTSVKVVPPRPGRPQAKRHFASSPAEVADVSSQRCLGELQEVIFSFYILQTMYFFGDEIIYRLFPQQYYHLLCAFWLCRLLITVDSIRYVQRCLKFSFGFWV